jgi:hypothetical protein
MNMRRVNQCVRKNAAVKPAPGRIAFNDQGGRRNPGRVALRRFVDNREKTALA